MFSLQFRQYLEKNRKKIYIFLRKHGLLLRQEERGCIMYTFLTLKRILVTINFHSFRIPRGKKRKNSSNGLQKTTNVNYKNWQDSSKKMIAAPFLRICLRNAILAPTFLRADAKNCEKLHS